MKHFILLSFAFLFTNSVIRAQGQGLQAVVVEYYYKSDAADSVNAANNGADPALRVGSVTYRVFLDMAPDYKFIQFFGNQDALANPIHPLVIKSTTPFYNDPNNGQIFPQINSITNTKKNTTLIDSWLSVGGVCAGRMGVLKSEDTDGSIGNSNNVLANNPGGLFGVPINSVNPNAADGMLPGTPKTPNALGLGTAADVFDLTPGNTFSVTNAAIAGLGGVRGVTPSNMVLIGQFTTYGQLTFSINVQLADTLTSTGEIYVPGNLQNGEFLFPGLTYTSPSTGTVVSLTEQGTESAQLQIYPNPNAGTFYIHIDGTQRTSQNYYNLYDITGRQVIHKDFVQVTGSIFEKVDIGAYGNGFYLLEVMLEGKRLVRKIVKE